MRIVTILILLLCGCYSYEQIKYDKNIELSKKIQYKDVVVTTINNEQILLTKDMLESYTDINTEYIDAPYSVDGIKRKIARLEDNNYGTIYIEYGRYFPIEYKAIEFYDPEKTYEIVSEIETNAVAVVYKGGDTVKSKVKLVKKERTVYVSLDVTKHLYKAFKIELRPDVGSIKNVTVWDGLENQAECEYKISNIEKTEIDIRLPVNAYGTYIVLIGLENESNTDSNGEGANNSP